MTGIRVSLNHNPTFKEIELSGEFQMLSEAWTAAHYDAFLQKTPVTFGHFWLAWEKIRVLHAVQGPKLPDVRDLLDNLATGSVSVGEGLSQISLVMAKIRDESFKKGFSAGKEAAKPAKSWP